MGYSRFSYVPTTDAQVRSGTERATLVRRTYGLVFLSVLVTMLGTAFAFAQTSVLQASAEHPFIMMLCLFAPLMMAQASARSFPRNVIFTLLFTFIEGVFIAPFLAYAELKAPGSAVNAAALTITAFGGLTLYALLSRRDFSAWGSFFMIGLLVLFVASLINVFVASAAATLWISAIGVLIFSGLLVFDTWRLLRSGQFGQDDYVLAAVQIYLDLLNMFLFILSLLSGGRNRR